MQQTDFGNVAQYFLAAAKAQPQKLALSLHGRNLNYAEFLTIFSQFHHGILEAGFKPGDRVLLLAPPSIELYALLMALMSLRLVCISIDASMPSAKILEAFSASSPDALVAPANLLRKRFLLPLLRPELMIHFPKMRFFSSDLSLQGFHLKPLQSLLSQDSKVPHLQDFAPHEAALITYTTGSTGRPKGADRATGILRAQHRISRDAWPHLPEEVDMPCFPMLALQNLSCGITTILPEVDFRSLGSFDPLQVIQQIRDRKVTRLSGPPSFFHRVSKALLERNESLETVRSLVTGGAPVPRWLAKQIRQAFPKAKGHIVYGSTEAEPISNVSLEEASDTEGAGYLVGRPIVEIEVKIIAIKLGEVRQVEPIDGLGEVVVRGPHVVQRYDRNPKATRLTKIPDGAGRMWHRTGDHGYFDPEGRLWLAGRISDQIWIGNQPFPNYFFDLAIESVPKVFRAAVLGGRSKKKRAQVFIETDANPLDILRLRQEVSKKAHEFCGSEVDLQILKKLPVDHRHFWKIDRKKLTGKLKDQG